MMNMMNNTGKLALCLCGLLAAAAMQAPNLAAAEPPAPAAPPPAVTAPAPALEQPGLTKVRATIVAVNKEKRQLTLDVDGKLHILAIGVDLKVLAQGQPATMEDFVPNQEIELVTRETPTGILVVSVDLEPALDPNEAAGKKRNEFTGNGKPFKDKKLTPKKAKKLTPKKPKKLPSKPKRPSHRPVVSPF
jgi:hypothetical protein